MIHRYIIKRIVKFPYQGLEFPSELKQNISQLKEDLAINLNLVFKARNYISEEKDYCSLSFEAQKILLEIVASNNTKYYKVLIDHDIPSYQTYLIKGLEKYFNVYSQEELLENVKDKTKSQDNTISQLVDGTLSGKKVEPEILNVLEEALKDKDADLRVNVLWTLVETPYLFYLRPLLEEMCVRETDEAVQGALDYLFEYEFSDGLAEEEIETFMSFNEQDISEVPQQVLESLQIKKLSLSENNLKSLPEELGNLTELKSLSVYKNSLTGLPRSLSQLRNLEEIFAYHNQIEYFPQFPPSIKRIYFSGNKIQFIPASIENLTALESLELDNNKIQEIHFNISKLSALEYLDLSRNPLHRIPEGITHLPKLKTLLLYDCPLEEFPDTFSGLKLLQSLEITGTSLRSIKPSIEQLTSLKELNLNISKLIDIPDDIILPKNLRSIGLSQANLKRLPASITRLKDITKLFLPFNSIEVLPNEIGECKKLKSLWFSDNHLKKLPESFWKLTNLEELRLENNFFPEDVKESIHQWAKQNQISLTI